ncbi:MAG: hypothetical protein ACTSRG_27070 [Candidatus Helarchaeota archaeon]
MKTNTENRKINTWLPIFTGFYNTIWQFQDDNTVYNINETRENNNLMPINWDVLDIDYKQYEYDIVQGIIEAVKSELSEYIESIEFQTIQSPQKYNFKNDSVDVAIIPKIENIRQCIYDNMDSFKIYLKNHYTSYDGFCSWYSNRVEDWESDTSEFTDFTVNGHYLGKILEFICEVENITEYDIYEYAKGDIYEDNYINNWDKCISCLICTKCNKLIENKDIIKIANKYKDKMNNYPNKIHCEDCMNNY